MSVDPPAMTLCVRCEERGRIRLWDWADDDGEPLCDRHLAEKIGPVLFAELVEARLPGGTVTFSHQEADDRNQPDVLAEHDAYLDDATILVDGGEALVVRQEEAADAYDTHRRIMRGRPWGTTQRHRTLQ